LKAKLQYAEEISSGHADQAFKTEAELSTAIAELKEAREAIARAELEAKQSEEGRAELADRVQSLEQELVKLGEQAQRGVKKAAEEQLEVAAAARALEKLASDARLSAAREEVVSLQALLEGSEENERLVAQELREREEELAALAERCSEVEDELAGMEADLDSVAMRAAAAEGELDLNTHRLKVEHGKRKQSEALAADRLGRVQELQAALEEATEEGRDREAKALASKKRLGLELTAALASATATVGVCAASAKVAEVRMACTEQAQGDLSRLVTQAESVAVGSVGRLQQQVDELRSQVASRDGRVGKLRESLRESQDATRSAEAGLARAVEAHSLRVAGLEAALRAAGSRESEAAHELSLLRAAVHGGQPQDPLLLSPGLAQLSGSGNSGGQLSTTALSLVGLTPSRSSKARVAYLERLRSDIAKLRADNQRLRMQQAHDGKDASVLSLTPSTPFLSTSDGTRQQEQQEGSSLHGDMSMEAPHPPVPAENPAPTVRRTGTMRSSSTTREASASLRAQNRTLHDHVQRSRRALTVIATAKAKLGAPKTVDATSSTATKTTTPSTAAESQGTDTPVEVDSAKSTEPSTVASASRTPIIPSTTLDVKLKAVVDAVGIAVDKENSGMAARTAANGGGRDGTTVGGEDAKVFVTRPEQQRVTPTRMQARLAEKRLSTSARKQVKSSKSSTVGASTKLGNVAVWVDSSKTASAALGGEVKSARKGARSTLRSFASPKASAKNVSTPNSKSSRRTPLATRERSTLF
jgi:hypothetical protein